MTAKSSTIKNRAMQPRQRATAHSAGMPRLADPYKLRQMKKATQAVLAIKPRRYLESLTGRSGAWWEHIAHGDFGEVKPTIIDWYVIKGISDTVGNESRLDGELLRKLTVVMEKQAALIVSVADLASSVRRKSKG